MKVNFTPSFSIEFMEYSPMDSVPRERPAEYISRIKVCDMVTDLHTDIDEEDRLGSLLIHLQKQNARILQAIATFTK